MAARKRPSLKGRGAEIFLSDPDANADADTEHQHARMPEARQAHTPQDPKAGKPAHPNARMPAYPYSGRKEKATFYLPEELLFALEEIWRDLRVLTRTKVTKSDIVQAALERAAGEFRENGAASRLLADLGLELHAQAGLDQTNGR
jgi:hypothetical protein